MIFIAHRGNINGPDRANENNPLYIQNTLSKGFDVEVDVWYHHGKWLLGHDFVPNMLEIDVSFFENPRIWTHAKNVSALTHLLKIPMVNCFYHDKDNVTITSKQYIWGFEGGCPERSIIVSFPPAPRKLARELCLGICSDFVQLLKEEWSKQ